MGKFRKWVRKRLGELNHKETKDELTKELEGEEKDAVIQKMKKMQSYYLLDKKHRIECEKIFSYYRITAFAVVTALLVGLLNFDIIVLKMLIKYYNSITPYTIFYHTFLDYEFTIAVSILFFIGTYLFIEWVSVKLTMTLRKTEVLLGNIKKIDNNTQKNRLN